MANENGQPGKNIVSDNNELIELSENVFSDATNSNILELFILGNDDFQAIDNYVNK